METINGVTERSNNNETKNNQINSDEDQDEDQGWRRVVLLELQA